MAGPEFMGILEYYLVFFTAVLAFLAGIFILKFSEVFFMRMIPNEWKLFLLGVMFYSMVLLLELLRMVDNDLSAFLRALSPIIIYLGFYGKYKKEGGVI